MALAEKQIMSKVYLQLEKDIDIFRKLLTEQIQPLAYDAALSGPFTDAVKPLQPVIYDTQHRLKLFVSESSRIYFLLKRLVPFSEEERILLLNVITALRSLPVQVDSTAAMGDIMDRVIAGHISRDSAELVYQIIQLYRRRLADSTGPWQMHTIGMYFNREKNTGVSLSRIRDEDILFRLGASEGTLLAIDRKGFIQGVESAMPTAVRLKKIETVLAPMAFAHIALWTDSKNRAIIRLSPNGSICLFKDRKLVFARVGGYWRHFPHDAFTGMLYASEGTTVEKEIRMVAYLTAIDLAFSGHRAAIGLIASVQHAGELMAGKCSISRDGDLSAVRPDLCQLVSGGRKFQELSRGVRAEICNLNGMTCVDAEGMILTGNPSRATRSPEQPASMQIKLTEDGFLKISRHQDVNLAWS